MVWGGSNRPPPPKDYYECVMKPLTKRRLGDRQVGVTMETCRDRFPTRSGGVNAIIALPLIHEQSCRHVEARGQSAYLADVQWSLATQYLAHHALRTDFR